MSAPQSSPRCLQLGVNGHLPFTTFLPVDFLSLLTGGPRSMVPSKVGFLGLRRIAGLGHLSPARLKSLSACVHMCICVAVPINTRGSVTFLRHSVTFLGRTGSPSRRPCVLGGGRQARWCWGETSETAPSARHLLWGTSSMKNNVAQEFGKNLKIL